MSTNETATISIVKDKDNWAVYGGAKFTNDTVDTLDLSVATLLESKGTLSDEDAVTCLGLAPGHRGPSYAKVYRNAAYTLQTSLTKVPFDTVDSDVDGLWDNVNSVFVPKKPGIYLCEAHFYYEGAFTNSGGYFYKNNSLYSYSSAIPVTPVTVSFGLIYFNGTTDYVELRAVTSDGTRALAVGVANNYFSLIGPLAV